MSRRSKSHFRRRLVLWGLLALLCIGLTELAVCAYADPALFQRITAPASRLFQTVRTAGAGLLDQLTPEEAPVSQLAGDPAISEAPPMEDANITEFAVRADREILTGGTVALTYYNQGEEPWTRSDLRLWVRSHRPVYAGLLSDRSGHRPGGNGSVGL